MTSLDQATRTLERDLDPEAAGALLRRRIRSGDVPEIHVPAAEALGYGPAVGVAEPREFDHEEWKALLRVAEALGLSRLQFAEVLCWGPPS